MIREKFSFLTSEDLSLSKSGDAEQTFSSSSSALLFFSFSVTNLSPVPFFFFEFTIASVIRGCLSAPSHSSTHLMF